MDLQQQEESPELDILIVESNPADARLIAEAFRDAGLTNEVQLIYDGDEALSLLRREGGHHSSTIPDLILLDLNLPRKSGLEILAEIRAMDGLDHIPVIIISGSANPADLRKAYQLRANCYIRKPNTLEEFLKVIQSCYQFWGKAVSLPPKPTYL
jgi:chemotaxis family two-component system response regulator Rcp1